MREIFWTRGILIFREKKINIIFCNPREFKFKLVQIGNFFSIDVIPDLFTAKQLTTLPNEQRSKRPDLFTAKQLTTLPTEQRSKGPYLFTAKQLTTLPTEQRSKGPDGYWGQKNKFWCVKQMYWNNTKTTSSNGKDGISNQSAQLN